LAASAPAQQARTVTAADYARAEKFLAQNVTGLVVGGAVNATWLPDDRFYYRNAVADGAEFILVDPKTTSRGRAFNHSQVAAALASGGAGTFDALHLPFDAIEMSPDATAISFNVGARRWRCDVSGGAGVAAGEAIAAPAAGRGAGRGGRGGGGGGRGRGAAIGSSSDDHPLTISPDGKRGVFIRDWNLWVRALATGEEHAL